MRKVIRIFLIIIIVLSLLLVTEVYAGIDYSNEAAKAYDDLDKYEFIVIVNAGGKNHRYNYDGADETDNRRVEIRTIEGAKYWLNDAIEVFVYCKTGNNDVRTCNGMKYVSGDIKDFTEITHGGKNTGNNGKYYFGIASFKLKNYGKTEVHVKLDTEDGMDIDVTMNFYIDEKEVVAGNNPFTDFMENVQDYMPSDSENMGNVIHAGGTILSVITTIGIIVSVVMCTVLGVKYMLSSVEEKADYKRDIIPYLVGACLLFGISGVVKILQSMGSNLNEHYPHTWDSGL